MERSLCIAALYVIAQDRECPLIPPSRKSPLDQRIRLFLRTDLHGPRVGGADSPHGIVTFMVLDSAEKSKIEFDALADENPKSEEYAFLQAASAAKDS